MIRAACHCGAVRFELEAPPAWVLDCNCTLCRRYGGLWIYPRFGTAKVLTSPDPEATTAYRWQEGDLAFQSCRTCGCVTHILAMSDPPVIFAVNARMIPTLDPATTSVRQVDNSHTGWFWTRSDAPPIESKHPKMPPPGPDDWR
jgi:hypothetical protein